MAAPWTYHLVLLSASSEVVGFQSLALDHCDTVGHSDDDNDVRMSVGPPTHTHKHINCQDYY